MLLRYPMRALDFPTDLILPATHGPEVDIVSNRIEYQEYSWGGGTKGCQ
jgi:hypothetical protein